MPLGRKVGLDPSDILLDGDTAPPPQKGGTAPNFRPMFVVAKRSPISATAEHLLVFYCCVNYSVLADYTRNYEIAVYPLKEHIAESSVNVPTPHECYSSQ